MRTILSIVLVIYLTSLIQAQDTLYRVNGNIQLVKVLEIKENAIRYQVSPSDGVIYNLHTAAIAKIIFNDGTIRTFILTSNTPDKRRNDDPRRTDFGRNLLSMNLSALTENHLSFGFEHTLKRGALSFRIPVSISLSKSTPSSPHDYNFKYTNFSTGIELSAYPYGQGKLKFFYGPAIEFGKRSFMYYHAGPIYGYEVTTSSYYALLLQCGFLFQPTKHVNLSVNVAMGPSSNIFSRYSGYDRGIVSRTGLHIGYKF